MADCQSGKGGYSAGTKQRMLQSAEVFPLNVWVKNPGERSAARIQQASLPWSQIGLCAYLAQSPCCPPVRQWLMPRDLKATRLVL